jgi:hypothetical protein
MTAITTTAVIGSIDEARLIRSIKAHIAKGEQCHKRGDQHFVSAGLELRQLKTQHTGTWAEWEVLLKAIGIGKSRASDLMQIADGTKTVEQTRALANTRKIKHRKSLRSGTEKPETDPQASADKRKIKYAAADAVEEESFLDDSGDYAPADPKADAAARIRGFLYRAQQSTFAAETDKLKGLTVTEAMLAAAQEAARAWSEVVDILRRDRGTT